MDFRDECKRRLVTAAYIQDKLGLAHRVYVRRLLHRGRLPEPVYENEYPRLNLYDRVEVDKAINKIKEGA